jgi:hypothetical protein
MARIKGSAMGGAVRALANRRDLAEPILATPLLRYLDESVSPSAWYPEEDLVALIRALLRLIPGSRDQVLETMGRISAREHLEGTYAHLIEGGELRNLGIRASTLWSAMHDTGEMRVTDNEPGRVRLELWGYGHPTEELCKISQGYMLEVLLQNGIDAEAEQVACAVEGAEACIWDFRYPVAAAPAPAR